MNPRRAAGAVALAAALLAGPGIAQAAAPAPHGQVAAATITWTLERAGNPTADQQPAHRYHLRLRTSRSYSSRAFSTPGESLTSATGTSHQLS